MGKIIETLTLTVLAIAMVRGYQLFTGQKLSKVSEKAMEKAEEKLNLKKGRL